MLRLDLEAANITYTVEGPDGPLFADFHSLRHSYLTLGGRAGIDLRTLQELAGHSTPNLTARYSHRRLHDLAGAVEKLPSFLPDGRPGAEPQALGATGTEGPGVLASCLAPLARNSLDLALLVERWDELPEAVRAGIIAMVKASLPKGGS